MKRVFFLLITVCASISNYAQNEDTKWYFGGYAALDFMTNPPTVLNNSSMNGGGSSIADSAGNLLFYVDGVYAGIIWNKQHQIMANGTNLNGGGAHPIIINHASNPNLYYVFTNMQGSFSTPPGSIFGLYYSIVDMSLAAGMGSVTVKNIPLYTSPCTPQLHATRHFNGTDFWIMIHEYSNTTNNFRGHLISSSGVNTTPVITSVGPIYSSLQKGTIKFSPTGQKLCIAINGVSVMLYDFDNITGLVSNPITLVSNPLAGYLGCEFSPDGTKLYAGNNLNPLSPNTRLLQWDLSTNISSAIISSSVNLMFDSIIPDALQLAPNGKIYIASNGSKSLTVINNPNVAGNGCNIVPCGQPISAAINSTLFSFSRAGLPNMFYSTSKSPCDTRSVNNPKSICFGNFYAISNHSYTTSGTYVDTLKDVFECNEIVVVNTQLTVNSTPTLNVISDSSICLGETHTLIASGASTYTWNNLTTGSQYTLPSYPSTGNFVYTIQLQGINSTGCVATHTFSNNVFVLSCDTRIDPRELTKYPQTILLFPNPTSGNLKVLYSDPTVQNISSYIIFNSLGQSVREEHLDDISVGIHTTDLGPGFYEIHFKSQFGTLTKKFVKTDSQ